MVSTDDGHDPFGGREPTSHERMAGQPWDASYRAGPAPWDIGVPQPAVVRLLSRVAIAGPVLDAGCGTGEHALLVAARGVRVLGVDVAETAIAMARQKAAAHGIAAEFIVGDAFHLAAIGRRFRTVLDCGLFHAFDAAERQRYSASLASVVEAGGIVYLLCFRDAGEHAGPHPVREEEIRKAFTVAAGWNVAAVEPERIDTRLHDDGAPGWLATITRGTGPA